MGWGRVGCVGVAWGINYQEPKRPSISLFSDTSVTRYLYNKPKVDIVRSHENGNAGIDWRELASISAGNVSEFAFFCRLKPGSREKNYCNITIVDTMDNNRL